MLTIIALQVVGRFIVGFGVSLSAIAECIYISEIAPAVSYMGRLRHEFQTLLYTIFDRKGTPFLYLPQQIVPLSYTNGATFTKLFTWEITENTWMNQPLGVSVWYIVKVPFNI